MKTKIVIAAILLAMAPACAQAQSVGGLVGDVVGGAVGTADTAVRDVVGAPRGYYRYHRGYRRCVFRHGRRYCR